jgi:hypothetical protein
MKKWESDTEGLISIFATMREKIAIALMLVHCVYERIAEKDLGYLGKYRYPMCFVITRC